MEKAPGKDLLRLFIRVSAIRSGTQHASPWVVNSDLVKEHKLVNKFADFFLSPMKASHLSYSLDVFLGNLNVNKYLLV